MLHPVANPTEPTDAPLAETARALVRIANAHRLNAEGYALDARWDALDARWDALAVGIESFFRVLGLAGRLPEQHRYGYFPSIDAGGAAGRPA